ncbi:MAG: nickel pincer cofactor biosynthesis protein LarC [candidate division KSB1 bacterium]|nr:nickel pincer cofactor biosynthesis protein LarC [candidate division KSB1 bacterium]MDZ7274593.1 nickel pincer cofactor biosynthesis protein LarC [candidate division KSB1 bacterium]MDZ7284746.1 nickel pincer cofactor biosynthesis protein LarC [candidate division KSB1 bacterium]MDZ7297834.1 nickel pincer cofactor biosynthesis protein LarC [candidate division KSB1 bacterium]MDZ7308875.1 nickel pincer cofactor biosynthesis protein LarC [candidate division KSB1 bacterium]
MPVAYFDCIAGASGDMILGALVDAGVPLEYLQRTAAALQLPGLQLTATKVKRHDISATRVKVDFPPEHRHRHLHHIAAIINAAGLAAEVKQQALQVFQRLAVAEARVHNTTPEKIHFHEVGAVDAIADVVCAVAGLHSLHLDAILVSKLPLGGGTVHCEHGIMPVPAPATVELLRGFPAQPGPIDFELVTPTGAAILTTLGKPCDRSPFTIARVGYGAGSGDFQELPNVLRLILGDAVSAHQSDTVMLLETNIDDMNPELYPFVIDRLLEAGALDAFLTPIQMKKGRPGILLAVLAAQEKVEELLGIIYGETTTLGVRLMPVSRRKLRRWQEEKMTSLGPVKIKVAEWQGRKHITPEYEECRRLALQQGLPLRRVYEIVAAESKAS